MLRFLFMEPFYGGSHRAFADGLVHNSRYRFDLAKMPARFWKWRMRGAALHFVNERGNLGEYDGIVVSDLMSLSDFKALCGPECPPVLVYFHENQFAYPLSDGEARDYQFGFTDITTAYCSDMCLFNSYFHRDQFLSLASNFIERMPDYQPGHVMEEIRKKAGVCYPGCDFEAGPPELEMPDEPPLVIWNHRWEHDKNPEDFFHALTAIRKEGIEFRLALLGERFSKWPPVFDDAAEIFENQIVQFGPVESRSEYIDWLKKGSVVVSTSNQENFGIAVIEAIRFGCLPLLPHRLSYPEIVSGKFHDSCIYGSIPELTEKLERMLTNHRLFDRERESLSMEMGRYSWANRIEEFDCHLAHLAAM